MPAEIGLYRPDYIALLRGEHCIFERLDHRTVARKKAEIAALTGGTRIVRILFGDFRELRRSLARLCCNVFCLLFCRCLLLFAGVGFDGDQNMARLALFRLAVLLEIIVVHLPDFGRIHGNLP